MKCEIIWNTLNLEQWQSRFNKVRRSNLLQSYAYAQGACPLYKQKARWGLIKINGEEAGLVQILEAGMLGNAIHAVMLDRGPLWFDEFGKENHFEAFCESLNKEFPARIGRKRRFIPEIQNSPEIQKILEKNRFKPKYEQKYATYWLNLEEKIQNIEVKLKKNWKNSLKIAKNSNISTKFDKKGLCFDELINNYAKNKQEKGYDGPSQALIYALAPHFIKEKNLIIGRALINDQPIADILVLCHGSSATYQIGWSSDLGRKNCAHHLLLWEALTILKNKGVKDFDLGGFNDETAKGVKKFKEGMGGEAVTGPGIFY